MEINDKVYQPAHYAASKIEVLEYIEDRKFNYNLGQVCKYISRAGLKDSMLQDLRKANFYLEREIELLQAEMFGIEPRKPSEQFAKERDGQKEQA